jgi:hypothetical protein
MGWTLHQNKKFVKRISHVSVDESYVVVSAGMPGTNGEPLYPELKASSQHKQNPSELKGGQRLSVLCGNGSKSWFCK